MTASRESEMGVRGQGGDDSDHVCSNVMKAQVIRSGHAWQADVPGALSVHVFVYMYMCVCVCLCHCRYLSTRGHVWTDVDNARTGGLPFVFDKGFGFEQYVDYAMDVPMYFVYRCVQV